MTESKGRNRREFLRESAWGAAAGLALQGQGRRRILIEAGREPSFRRRLAERELLRGQGRLRPGTEARLASSKAEAGANDLWFSLRVAP